MINYMDLFPEVFSTEKAKAIQESLSQQVIKEKCFTRITTITGVDVSYRGDRACASLVTLSFPDFAPVEQVTAITGVACEYIPGFLSFREGPPVIAAYKKAKQKPQLLLCDGHGIAHPRGAGLATHLGIFLDIPSIGCAKKILCGKYNEPPGEKGAYSLVMDEYDRCIGDVLRTRDNIKPVFVSIGHMIDLKSATEIVGTSCLGFRIPEPLRMAHMLSGEWGG
jgi:deoxyribonuclease V